MNGSAQIDNDDDDGADEDVLHEGMNPEQVEHVAQAPYDQCADNGHGHGAAPASEIHATDDAGGDGVQLVCVTLCGVDGVQLGRQQQADTAAQKPEKPNTKNCSRAALRPSWRSTASLPP